MIQKIDIKVSVIVPVYKVEAYLRRCLDSLINQTLKDIEIICVNDCSPDNSLAILKEYAEKDNRIKIIDFEKNQGVAVARNAGLEIAKGDYLGVVDSDDYVDLDYYEKLYVKAKETDADMVQAGYKIKKLTSAKEYIYEIKNKKNKYDNVFSHWCFIYRISFLQENSLSYPVGIKLSQDEVFFAKALYFANKIEIAYNVFYHYIIRDGSASRYIGSDIHESYGMPLVFDFINKTITDKEEYGHFFGHFFGYLCYLFTRIAHEWRYIFVQDIVEIYQKRKYPIILKNLPKFLKINDFENSDILFKKLNDNLELLEYPQIGIGDLRERKLYIWGAGADGLNALIQCDNNGWHVEVFLDSNSNIKEFQGYKVLQPQSLLNSASKDFFIVISSRDYADEISVICKKAGLKEGLDFWKPN